MAALQEPIDLTEYFFRRVKQCGVQSIFGVPGDYNLTALDYIAKLGLRWVGNVTELNAGYAADAYARLKHLSVLVSTFGVGELSALNAIAGSFAEFVPVIHLVGTPSTLSQRNGMILHHTLGNGDFTVFSRMSAEISCAVANLSDPDTAAAQIDSLIQRVVLLSRPGYVTLPSNLVAAKVEGARLRHKLDFSIPPNEPERERYVAAQIAAALRAATRPCVLVDACVVRHRALQEATGFIATTRLPTFVTPMGKSAVDEALPNFGGVYAGTASEPAVREFVESSDLVLSLGCVKSDLNTAGFSVRLSRLNTIDLCSNGVKAHHAEFPGVRMNGLLRVLTDEIRGTALAGQIADSDNLSVRLSPLLSPTGAIAALPEEKPSSAKQLQNQAALLLSSLSLGGGAAKPSSTGDGAASGDPSSAARKHPPHVLTHEYLWPRISSWLRTGDVIVTETGTSLFGIWGTRFPPGARAVNGILWGSIGYATAGAVGASLAVEDEMRTRPDDEIYHPDVVAQLHRKPLPPGQTPRVILFTGDGSFQLAVQEIGTALRHHLCPIIFLLHNRGFTIERLVHNLRASYHDIAEWRYELVPKALGGDVYPQVPAPISSLAGQAASVTEQWEQKLKAWTHWGGGSGSGAVTPTPTPGGESAGGLGRRHHHDPSRHLEEPGTELGGREGLPGADPAGGQEHHRGQHPEHHQDQGHPPPSPRRGKAKVWKIRTRDELEALLSDEHEWAPEQWMAESAVGGAETRTGTGTGAEAGTGAGTGGGTGAEAGSGDGTGAGTGVGVKTRPRARRYLRLIELQMPWDDAPEALVQVARHAAQLNQKAWSGAQREVKRRVKREAESESKQSPNRVRRRSEARGMEVEKG